jgi:hypothetical protein
MAGDGTRDGGLAGASHTLQPKDDLVVRVLGPSRYLFEEIDSSTLKALRMMLIDKRVKSSAIGIWQLGIFFRITNRRYRGTFKILAGGRTSG